MNLINEIGITYKPTTISEKQIGSALDAIEILNDFYDKEEITYKESFHVLILNRANMVTGHRIVATGSDTGCIVPIKEIVALAIKTLACGIILSHNHPSGNQKPSQADIQITERINQVLKLLDIPLLDHIIITPDGKGYSMRDNGDVLNNF